MAASLLTQTCLRLHHASSQACIKLAKWPTTARLHKMVSRQARSVKLSEVTQEPADPAFLPKHLFVPVQGGLGTVPAVDLLQAGRQGPLLD